MAPGHAASGKAGDYAMAATFARNGFVVLSYDPIGQGERLQYLDPKNATKMQAGDPYPGVSLATRPTGEHGEAGLQPTLIGDAVARYFAVGRDAGGGLFDFAAGGRCGEDWGVWLLGRRGDDGAAGCGGQAGEGDGDGVLSDDDG